MDPYSGLIMRQVLCLITEQAVSLCFFVFHPCTCDRA